jgi:hypothetical protein
MHPALLPILVMIPLWNGEVTVQDGVSAGGVHWRMSSRPEHGGRIFVSMSVRDFDGWGMSGPVTARDPLMMDSADGIGETDEQLVDGVVYKTVAALRVETAKRTVVIHARSSPAKALRSYRRLKDYRFFVHWFAAGDTPNKVTALDRDGNVVAEWGHTRAPASVRGA